MDTPVAINLMAGAAAPEGRVAAALGTIIGAMDLGNAEYDRFDWLAALSNPCTPEERGIFRIGRNACSTYRSDASPLQPSYAHKRLHACRHMYMCVNV